MKTFKVLPGLSIDLQFTFLLFIGKSQETCLLIGYVMNQTKHTVWYLTSDREKILNINIHRYISYFAIVISRIVIPMPSYTSLLYICFTLVIIPYQHFCIYTLYLVLLQYSLLVFGKEWFSLGAWINRLSLRCNSDRNTEQNHPDDYDKHIIFNSW